MEMKESQIVISPLRKNSDIQLISPFYSVFLSTSEAHEAGVLLQLLPPDTYHTPRDVFFKFSSRCQTNLTPNITNAIFNPSSSPSSLNEGNIEQPGLACQKDER